MNIPGADELPLLEELTLHLQDFDDRPDLDDKQKYAPTFIEDLASDANKAVARLCNALANNEKSVSLAMFFVIANTASALSVPDEEWMQLRSLVPPEEWIALRDQNEQQLSNLLDAISAIDEADVVTSDDVEKIRDLHFTNQTAAGLALLCERVIEGQLPLPIVVHKQLTDVLDDWRVSGYEDELAELVMK